jgi:hypothetical protein
MEKFIMMKIPETNIVLETMPKRALNYYKHLKIVFFWSSVVKFSFLGLALTLAVTTFMMRAELDATRIQASFVVSAMLFCIFTFWQFFQKFFLQNINNRRVNVFENRIEIFQEDGEGEKFVVNFNDVEKVDWGFFSFFGVFTISTQDRVYRFSSFLHRAEYILEAIEEYRPQIFEKMDFEDLRNNVLSADHRLSRVHDMFFGRYKLLSLFCYFLLPVLGGSVIVWHQVTRITINFLPDYVWSLVNIVIAAAFFVGMFHFLVTEFLFDKDLQIRLKEDFNDKGRDLEYEEGILAKSNPAKIFAIALAFYSISAHDVNQFGYYRINNSSADLQVIKNDVYMVDKRYNCLECVYALEKNHDIVFIHDETLHYGRVIVDSNRQPASAEETTVVALKINDRGDTVQVPFKQILGRVIRED